MLCRLKGNHGTVGDDRPYVMMTGLRSVEAQGGIETHVRELGLRLATRGVKVEVVERAPYAVPTRSDDGILRTPLWCLRHRNLEAISSTFLAVLLAGWRRPSVLHIHGIGPALLTPLAKMLGLRVVVTHHGRDYEREKWGSFARIILRAGEWFALKLADEVIAVSSALGKELGAKGCRKVHGIPNGVSPSTLAGEVEATFNYPYILAVGRLVPEKRHLDLIRAFLAANHGDLRLLIAGGADHESPYAAELRSVAALSARVHLLGAVSHAQVRALYAGAELFVMPSSHEGLPIALLEAMSAGCRVVASDIAPHLEIGLPDEAYFPVGNVEALTHKINASIGRAPRPVDWSDKLSRFDWNVIVDDTMRVYGV